MIYRTFGISIFLVKWGSFVFSYKKTKKKIQAEDWAVTFVQVCCFINLYHFYFEKGQKKKKGCDF